MEIPRYQKMKTTLEVVNCVWNYLKARVFLVSSFCEKTSYMEVSLYDFCSAEHDYATASYRYFL